MPDRSVSKEANVTRASDEDQKTLAADPSITPSGVRTSTSPTTAPIFLLIKAVRTDAPIPTTQEFSFTPNFFVQDKTEMARVNPGDLDVGNDFLP